MVCSYWRGALAVLVGWAGLAWAQTPAPTGPVAAGTPERIMVVHENGASIRCRVLHTWLLPDGRTAHQLQALETGEMITIVDDALPEGAPPGGLRGLPKRIFHWGRRSHTPPSGAPIPPHLVDMLATPSGVVVHQDVPPPGGFPRGEPVIMEGSPGGPVVMNGPHGGPVIMQGGPNGPMIMEGTEVVQSQQVNPARGGGLFNRLLAGRETTQVIEGSLPPGIGTSQAPLQIHEHPLPAETVVLGPDGTPLPPNMSGQGGVPVKAPTLRERVASLFQGSPNKSPYRSASNGNGAANSPAPFSAAADRHKFPGGTNTGKPSTSPLSIPAPPSQAKSGVSDPSKGSGLFNRHNTAGAGSSADAKKAAPRKKELVHLPPPLPDKKKDCLCDPEKFNPSTKHLKKHVATQTCSTPGCSTPSCSTPGGMCSPAKGCWPLGAQSVLAATGGAPARVIYVPVPMKSVPYPVRPPDPPPPAIPQPPQANLYCNGFSQAMAQAAPAPAPWQLAGAFAGPMTPAQAQQAQAYGWNPQAALQAQWMYAQMQQAALWHAYSRSMPPVNPYAAGRMPTQVPQTMNYPRNYPGPQPPNPFATAAAQTGVAPMPMPMPALPMPGAAYAQASIEQLIRTLREAPLPSERELAAQALAQRDPQTNPQIVPALLQAASHDPAPSVRAGCVHCVARLGGVDRGAVHNALYGLRGDSDPNVRHEVEQALARLGTSAK